MLVVRHSQSAAEVVIAKVKMVIHHHDYNMLLFTKLKSWNLGTEQASLLETYMLCHPAC
jgi:hypothetical protein